MKKEIGIWFNGFCLGVAVTMMAIMSFSSIRDTKVIKMYTEGKIVCTTLADKFVCEEVEK